MLDIELVSKCIDKLDFKFPYSSEEWADKMYIENQHKHTTWSNPRQIDSGTSLEEFFKINYDRGAKLYFSGEHGTQGNWLRCYDMCHDKKLGEKLGIELPRYRHSTEAYWVKDRHIQDNKNCHIVIVARNYNASRKLNYILSVANETLENDGGFYNKPRIDLELIKYLTKDDVYVMSACFTENMIVQTKKGDKKITEVKEDDEVLTHLGKWEKVNKKTIREYNDDLYLLNIEGSPKHIECTRDHKFPTIKKTHNDVTKEIVWKRADELDTSDRILSVVDERIEDIEYLDFTDVINKRELLNPKRNRKQVPKKIKITNEFLELLGIYTAEGSLKTTNKSGIVFTLNLNDNYICTKVVSAIKNIFSIDPYIHIREKENRMEVSVLSTQVYEIFNYLFNSGAINKEVPMFIRTLPFKKQMHFVKGFFNGDGHIDKEERHRISCCSISRKLILQIISILERNCIKVGSSVQKEYLDKNNVHHCESYTISITNKEFYKYWIKFRHSDEEYRFNWNENVKWNSKKEIVINGVRYQHKKVVGINKQKYMGNVYCLDVNNIHSFKLEGISVHNCVAGWKYDDADDIWLDLAKHFEDSFFFEYQAHNTTQQKELNKHIQDLAKKYNIKTIIGLDTHVISEEDNIRRDNLLKRKGFHYDDEEGWYLDYPDGKELFKRMKEQGILSDEEIIISMMNTHVFVDGCEDFTLDKDFKIPILPKNQNLTYSERVKQLTDLIHKKYSEEENQTQDRYEGMEYEIGQIAESTTADYFIMNHDIVHEAIKNGGILTKSSRGSASSYYTSKLLGFTNMDRFESEVPVFPERFITKDRILSSHQCPDIDYNVSTQQPFLDASRKVLGGYHTCYPLVAFGKISEKSGWKLYADIKGITPAVANAVSKDIDKYLIAYSNAEDEDKKDIKVEDYISKEYAEIFNDSIYYRGIIDGAKQHACGHITFNGNPRQKDVVGYGDIRYEFGLIRCKSASTGKSVICANVEGSYLDAYGYVKNDYLIVAVVSLIDKIYKALKKETPSVSQLRKMVKDDESTWKLYEMGATLCLNQCEKDSTTKKVMTYKPKNVRELTAFIAGIRPGFRSLINTLLTRTPYSTGEEAIDKILEDSFHFMLYQEAIMKIFTYLGIPMKDSYDTIKGISKKKLKGEKLKHVEDNLKEHWLENIGNMDNFEKIYQVIKDSSKYSFNAPHANAMAIDSLYVAYPKAHFTDVFYEVALNHHQERGEKDKVNALLVEAINFFDYKIGEYEYGKDNSKFTVDKETKTIYPSLASVKGIGSQAVIDMMNIYKSGKDNIVDIYLAIKGTKVNKSTFQKLVKIGYFKKYGSTKQLLSILEIVDKWKGSTGEGRKTIPKSAIKDLGLENIDIYKYATDVTKSGKVSDKQFTNVDWIGIAKELSSRVSTDEYKLGKLIKNEYEVLGYINRKDDSIDKRYIVVTNLDTTWSPKFEAYCINNGKTCEMKIHNKSKRKNKEIKTYFQDIPIEDGDILYMKVVKKDVKRKMIDGEFVEEEGMYDWWINDYIKVTI